MNTFIGGLFVVLITATVFHEAIKQALKADARRPKHERRTAKALSAEIKTAGLKPGRPGKPKKILWTA